MLCGAAGSRELFLSILTIFLLMFSGSAILLLGSISTATSGRATRCAAGRSRPSARAGSARTLTVAEPEPGTVLDAARRRRPRARREVGD